MRESILIIDFGSQVTKLIARRIREIGVFSQVIPFSELEKEKIDKDIIKGIIFSGGPRSVDKRNAPKISSFVYNLDIPILGICYGLQLIARQFKGDITPSHDREFGKRHLFINKNSPLFEKVYIPKKKYQIWMSHSDKVSKLPLNFEKIGSSESCEFAAIQDLKRKKDVFFATH